MKFRLEPRHGILVFVLNLIKCKMNITTLGKATVILSYCISYFFFLVSGLGIVKYEINESTNDFNNHMLKNMLPVLFLFLVVFLLSWLLKFSLSNYRNYTKYLSGAISKKKYVKYWYYSILSVFLIFSVSLFLVDSREFPKYGFDLSSVVALIIIISLIPNTIFLYKTKPRENQ